MDMIVQTACDLLEKGEVFVLATIISHSGSTPRSSGSRMIVRADGRGIGTIGGGILEAEAMARAVQLIRDGQSAIMPFDLNAQTIESMDMICGGQAEVLLDCLRPTPMNVTVFKQWQCLLDERQPGWLLSIVDGAGDSIDRINHCLLTAVGEIIGHWPLPEVDRETVVAATADMSAVGTLQLDDVFVVVEPAQQACTIHLFGAGHVALSTSAVAAMVGFQVSVADDREAYSNRERFPNAHEIRVLKNFELAFAGYAISRDDYIVIVTRGHLHDKTVLAQALRTDAGYIGMIGSRKKRNAIYGALLNQGFVQADIDRVHSPIGMSIEAETPEEIAVSIVAEMIQHRALSK